MTGMPWKGDADAEHLRHVYGAALASAADQAVAEDVSIAVMRSAAGENALPRARLVARAILVAMRNDPAPPFAGLPSCEREALALARLGGLNVPQIARELACDERGVVRLLRSALLTLAGEATAARPERRAVHA